MSESSSWICPDCGYKVDWTIKDVANKGTPVCPECDIDCKLKEEIGSSGVDTNISDEEIEEKSSDELIQDFIDEEKLHFEGEQAIESLNKVTEALGYKEESFRYGSSFERFIADNPGCCQAIIDWIVEYMDKVPEWKEGFKYED